MVNKKKNNFILLALFNIFLIVLGAYLFTMGTNIFLLPNMMTTGGASGIATIFYFVFKIPLGVTILVINIPLFVISFFKLGFKYSIKTLFATLLLSIFLEVFKFNDLLLTRSVDMVISSIFGGMLVGFGLSLILKAGCSSGGSDLLAQIIYKTTGVQSISKILMVIEFLIISALIIVLKNINSGLYSLIALYISTKILDIVFEGVNYTKIVTIITRSPQNIINEILNDLKRSATITKTIGAHSGEDNTTITCIVTSPQISKIKKILRENDGTAIMYITSANEVIGNGFKHI